MNEAVGHFNDYARVRRRLAAKPRIKRRLSPSTTGVAAEPWCHWGRVSQKKKKARPCLMPSSSGATSKITQSSIATALYQYTHQCLCNVLRAAVYAWDPRAALRLCRYSVHTYIFTWQGVNSADSSMSLQKGVCPSARPRVISRQQRRPDDRQVRFGMR